MENGPTIRDVAKAAGVGASTVSLALRNDPRLRPAMRERVQKIANELGYRPNAAVVSLMAQLRGSRTAKFQSTIGFINASEDPVILREIPTFREWTKGAQERAHELGYTIDYFWLHEPKMSSARLKTILTARGIRGLIVAAMQTDGILPANYEDLWPDFSTVVIGMRPKRPSLHFVSNDQYLTAFQAIGEVTRLGYRRPGLVINPEIDGWLEHRFSAGFFAHNRLLTKTQIPAFPFTKSSAKAFDLWLKMHQPDVIVTLHAEVKGWLEAAKIMPPQDIGLIHLDRDSSLNGWAGMDQNGHCVGSGAVDLVVGQLHRNDRGVPDFPKAMQLPCKWLPGGTVRDRNGSAGPTKPAKARPKSTRRAAIAR